MNELLLNIIYFISSYILIFIIYVFIINRNKKSYTEGSKQLEVNYLVSKFNLDKRKTKYPTIKWCVNIINPLIISTTFVIVTNIESFSLSILVGFSIMMILVYSIYEILGRTLKKKEEKN